MEFIDFKEANHTLGPPKGMTEDQVHSIRVYTTQMDPKVDQLNPPEGHFFVGMVQFTDEELAEIKKTNCMCVMVMGVGWPPMSFYPAVSVENQNPET